MRNIPATIKRDIDRTKLGGPFIPKGTPVTIETFRRNPAYHLPWNEGIASQCFGDNSKPVKISDGTTVVAKKIAWVNSPFGHTHILVEDLEY